MIKKKQFTFIFHQGDCGKEETINHLFLECEFFGSIWRLLHRWLDIYTAIPSDVGCQTQHYFGAHDFKREVCSCFQGCVDGLPLDHLERT